MQIAWSGLSQCYEFDTGEIMGGIQPFTNYHGICGLMHRDYMAGAVRHNKAFLNAEYYLRPGSGMVMYPRRLSLSREVAHDLTLDGVAIRFPAEPDFGLEMDLHYRPLGDAVDLKTTIRPSVDIRRFEVFFASYIAGVFDETWVPIANVEGARAWTRLDNREVINRTFGVAGNDLSRAMIQDGRYGERDRGLHRDLEERDFSLPILAARDSSSGFTLVFLCDPVHTTYLTGQYHGWDTAHDWCYGGDLTAGKEMVTRTRMVYRCFPDARALGTGIDELWAAFADPVFQ
ncbi:MAG: hypothetical protein OXU79_09185 [Gemmatimonadota bacterium]|nr:hypothetical protein [Gemmatimonadota bacterium]